MIATCAWSSTLSSLVTLTTPGGRSITLDDGSNTLSLDDGNGTNVQMAPTGVTVNEICPGYVDTPMTDRTLAIVESRAGLSHDMALAAVLATTGQDRLITPEEVATSVLALCMEEAGGVTGQAVLIRGGVRTP